MVYEFVFTNPLLLLTRKPGSKEHVVADLGRISISNAFQREDATATALGRWKESVRVKMTEMTLTSGTDGFRLVEDIKVAVTLGWDAPFQTHLLADPMRVHCDISRIDVRMCERHYALLLAVWTENLMYFTLDAPGGAAAGLAASEDRMAASMPNMVPPGHSSPRQRVPSMALSAVLPPRGLGGQRGSVLLNDGIGSPMRGGMSGASMNGMGSAQRGLGTPGIAESRDGAEAPGSMHVLLTLGRVSLSILNATDDPAGGATTRRSVRRPRIDPTPIAKFSLSTLRFNLMFDQDGPADVDASVVSLTVEDLRPNRHRFYEHIVSPRIEVTGARHTVEGLFSRTPGDDRRDTGMLDEAWIRGGAGGNGGTGAGGTGNNLFLHITYVASGIVALLPSRWLTPCGDVRFHVAGITPRAPPTTRACHRLRLARMFPGTTLRMNATTCWTTNLWSTSSAKRPGSCVCPARWQRSKRSLCGACDTRSAP